MLKRVSLIVAVWAFTAASASAERCYTWAGGGSYPFGTWNGIGGFTVRMDRSTSKARLVARVGTAVATCRQKGAHFKRQVAHNYPDDIASGHHFFDDDIEACEDHFKAQKEAYADQNWCDD